MVGIVEVAIPVIAILGHSGEREDLFDLFFDLFVGVGGLSHQLQEDRVASAGFQYLLETISLNDRCNGVGMEILNKGIFTVQ